MQFSYILLKSFGKGNFNAERKQMQEMFKNRINRHRHSTEQLMKLAGRDFWRCDPNRHEEGKTFLQITRLLQGYVENEVNMNLGSSCTHSCSYFNWGVRQTQCYKGGYCSKQHMCAGRLYDCEFIDSTMQICPAAESSNRRYKYIQYENGNVLGQIKHCNQGTTKVASWWPSLYFHCSYCFCLCDDDGIYSDRFISLRESVSNIMHNKVVTGLRFVKKNRIIFLIVQQGRLRPQGRIDNTSLEWVQPQYYDDSWTHGMDYHKLDRENRALNLDDINMPQGYVMTGVRFRLYSEVPSKHLSFMIRVTKIDFVSGKLINRSDSQWIRYNPEVRTELQLNEPHIPILSPSKSIPDSTSNQFIRFRESDRSKDASQTTVPFFDAQPVVPAVPVPLSGAGLFHKGLPKFGGFIAPKVITYDLSSLL